MSFSDDHASPAAPFSGDETGQIFDAPDMVLESPMTAERVVDTQSGFLVVVKALEGRQSLSVKRRLGTPPSTSILLTPDESVKLSRILCGAPPAAQRRGPALSAEAEQWLSQFEEDRSESLSRTASPSYNLVTGALRGLVAITLLTLILIGGLVGWGVQNAGRVATKIRTVTAAVLPFDPLESQQVDRFVRSFVNEMLDFSPNTYRASQIKAMAVMDPALIEAYWKDTHFPLPPAQLKKLPSSSVVISQVKLQRLDANTVNADVFATLNGQQNQSTPLHLQLKIAADSEKRLQVIAQKDLSQQ